jgi:hypothetical protein
VQLQLLRAQTVGAWWLTAPRVRPFTAPSQAGVVHIGVRCEYRQSGKFDPPGMLDRGVGWHARKDPLGNR